MLHFGEMVEWFKAAFLKTAAGSPRRGFESRSLRPCPPLRGVLHPEGRRGNITAAKR